MGYTLYQPAPSPGRLPVDAPKRYGWDAPVRSTSRAARLQPAVSGPRPERAGCFVVLAFYFVSCLCLLSIARPWGSSREPCRPLLSALSPRDRRAPCCGLPHPRRTQRPVPPGTATARLAVWPGDVCAGPGTSSLWGQQGAEMPQEGGILGSALSSCESQEGGSALEG